MRSHNTVEKLKQEFDENINSHVFLVETNQMEECLKDIKSIIKNKLNANDITAKQIDEETYLEQIIIRSEGKDIKKDQIMLLQERLKTKPILSDYIFYIIAGAEHLSEISANKLLKTIEEPNDNVIGFLLAQNSDQILPTIKSRCSRIEILYENEINNQNISPELLDTVKKLIFAIETKDHIEFYKIKSQEKIMKENYQIIENLIKDYYNMACNLMNVSDLDNSVTEFIQKNNTENALIKKAKFLNRFLNKLIENMNGDLVLESIYLNLKEVN